MRHTHILPLSSSQSAVFCQPVATTDSCNLSRPHCWAEPPPTRRHTFFRSYGVNLPSSFQFGVLSSASVFLQLVHLCRFPVRFNDFSSLSGFSWKLASATSSCMNTGSSSHLSNNEQPDFPNCSSYSLKLGLPTPS